LIKGKERKGEEIDALKERKVELKIKRMKE
jgi:hypothetical protein